MPNLPRSPRTLARYCTLAVLPPGYEFKGKLTPTTYKRTDET
jgi:hypothetical protein